MELGYRNRIRVFSNPINHYGLMRRGTHEVVPLESCALMPDQFNRDILPWLRMLPPAEQIVVRMDGRGGWLVSIFGPSKRLKVMRKVLAALPENEPPAPGCVGLLFNNLPLWGRDYLIHEIAGHKYRVGAQSFFQGNHTATEEALLIIRSWLAELKAEGALGAMLGDFFCGVGLFSLALADLFEKVVAVDSDQGGCRDAENNVQHSEAARDKVRVYPGRLAKILTQPDLAPPALWNASCCLVDPPRAGLGKDGVKTLLQVGPRHLLYMSCDPATLARDAAAFIAAGYQARKLRVLDMFPRLPTSRRCCCWKGRSSGLTSHNQNILQTGLHLSYSNHTENLGHSFCISLARLFPSFGGVMRYFALLTIALIAFIAQPSQARTKPGETERQRHDGTTDWVRLPAGQSKARVDSLYLLGGPGSWDGSFETPGGDPDWHGWTHEDLTLNESNHWHISTYWAEYIEGHGLGNHALYCGNEAIPACAPPDTIGGVGPNWLDDVAWRYSVADPLQPVTVRLTGLMNYDLPDAGWDFLELYIQRGDEADQLGTWTGTTDTTVTLDFTTVLSPGEFTGPQSDEVYLFWRVWTSSDGWDDVDCINPSHGACQIDDLSVYLDNNLITFDDFEPGSTVSWNQTELLGVGDFSICATTWVTSIPAGTTTLGRSTSSTTAWWCWAPGYSLLHLVL